MVVSNNYTETRVETISRENDDVEDVHYQEINFELPISENIAEWQTSLLNKTASNVRLDNFPIALEQNMESNQ